MRLTLIAIVALLLLANGGPVAAQPPGPADPAGLSHRRFTIAGVRYELLLPPKGELSHTSDVADSFGVTDNAKSKDYTHHFALTLARYDESTPSDLRMTLQSGTLFRYRLRENMGRGTFGRISELTGEMQIGAHTLSVACWDQDERRPAPEWCIAYLHHLKLAAEQPAPPPADCARIEVAVNGEKHCRPSEPSNVKGFKDCPQCPEMVVAPAGSFMMGSPPDEPGRSSGEDQVRVTIAKPFAVGRFAVTYAEWEACLDAGGCAGHRAFDLGWGRDQRPVIGVTWHAAKAYVDWLSKTTGKSYRLPSEAEREYVARAGTTTPYWWGSSISGSQANYDSRVTHAGGVDGMWLQKTVPVDTFAPNPWGLYNVHGNVTEWTEDCENHDGNVGNPGDGTARTTGDCSGRMLRGGSWRSDHAAGLRSAARRLWNVDDRDPGFGFRVVRTLD